MSGKLNMCSFSQLQKKTLCLSEIIRRINLFTGDFPSVYFHNSNFFLFFFLFFSVPLLEESHLESLILVVQVCLASQRMKCRVSHG